MTTIEHACKRTAQHETLHCAYATSCGLQVDWIRCRPSGEASFSMPFALNRLHRIYTQHPVRTLAQLRIICGTLLAPYIILDGIPRGTHPMEYAVGPDRKLLEQWGARWEFWRWQTTPPGPTWRSLCIDSRYRVLGWHGDVYRRGIIDLLTQDLLDVGMLDGFTWGNLVREYTPATLRRKDKDYYAKLV